MAVGHGLLLTLLRSSRFVRLEIGLEELAAAPILRGARGRPPVDLDAVVEAVRRVSLLAVEFPAVRELDVNPLLATPEGVVAVDFRAVVDPEPP